MNIISKIFFWTITIALGFVNPLISFGLIILYYLPQIIQSVCQPCKESNNIENTEYTFKETDEFRSEQPLPKMDSFSEDVLEDMK